MEIITLYHGSPNKMLLPTYGMGEDKHDYGRGLYLTPEIELAREWAVCNETNGFLYQIDLELDNLKVLDFDQIDPKAWIAELMSHRDADNSVRYRRFAPAFIMNIYLERYNRRDSSARKNLIELIESDRNKLIDTFSNYN